MAEVIFIQKLKLMLMYNENLYHFHSTFEEKHQYIKDDNFNRICNARRITNVDLNGIDIKKKCRTNKDLHSHNFPKFHVGKILTNLKIRAREYLIKPF